MLAGCTCCDNLATLLQKDYESFSSNIEEFCRVSHYILLCTARENDWTTNIELRDLSKMSPSGKE